VLESESHWHFSATHGAIAADVVGHVCGGTKHAVSKRVASLYRARAVERDHVGEVKYNAADATAYDAVARCNWFPRSSRPSRHPNDEVNATAAVPPMIVLGVE